MVDESLVAKTIQLVEETAHITKRTVETGRVRVRTVVETREETIREDMAREVLSVERRAVERQVSEAPLPREEGDVTIISIVEEWPVRRAARRVPSLRIAARKVAKQDGRAIGTTFEQLGEWSRHEAGAPRGNDLGQRVGRDEGVHAAHLGAPCRLVHERDLPIVSARARRSMPTAQVRSIRAA